jgi:ribosomal-protein-alanine N-acetyltransferase
MLIQFKNYQIRNFQIDDVDSLVKYANNSAVSKFLRDSFPFPYTRDDAEKWIDFASTGKNLFSFAIVDEKELIGGIGAVPYEDVHRYTAEVGFWLGEQHWNKGILSEALKCFCNYIFTEYNFNRLTANVFEENLASRRVLEKTGFILEGTLKKSVFKQNKFLDQYVYGLLKENFRYDSKSS